MSVVRSIMKRRLTVADPDESVLAAVTRMSECKLGALLIVDNGLLQGIFTERDLLKRVVVPGRDPATTRLKEVSTPDPTAATEDTSIEACTALIRDQGIRHLPVVDDEGRAIGIISSRDLLQFVVEGLESYIDRFSTERRHEEMTDPYESMVDRFDQ